jgi:hypothetical protein
MLGSAYADNADGKKIRISVVAARIPLRMALPSKIPVASATEIPKRFQSKAVHLITVLR